MDLQYLSKYRQVLGKSSRTHAVILKEAVEVLATVTIYEEIMKFWPLKLRQKLRSLCRLLFSVWPKPLETILDSSFRRSPYPPCS